MDHPDQTERSAGQPQQHPSSAAQWGDCDGEGQQHDEARRDEAHHVGVEVTEDHRPCRELRDVDDAVVDSRGGPPVERAGGRADPPERLAHGVEVAGGEQHGDADQPGDHRCPPGWPIGQPTLPPAGQRDGVVGDGHRSRRGEGGDRGQPELVGDLGQDPQRPRRHGQHEPPCVVVVEHAAGEPRVERRQLRRPGDRREVGHLHRLLAAARRMPEVGVGGAQREHGGEHGSGHADDRHPRPTVDTGGATQARPAALANEGTGYDDSSRDDPDQPRRQADHLPRHQRPDDTDDGQRTEHDRQRHRAGR